MSLIPLLSQSCVIPTLRGVKCQPPPEKPFKRLQNRATRIVLGRDSSKDTLSVLGWADLEIKRKRHTRALVYKCLNMLVPQYLCIYFIKNYNVHSYETSRRTDLHLPKAKLGLGKQSFKYSGMGFFYLLSC